MAFLNEYGVAQLWSAMKERLSGAFNRVDFDVAEAASNLVSGDSIPTAFGKLAKNYSSILKSISDLNTSLGNRISELNTDLTSKINTKLNKSDVLANYTTTATGKALDASLGPTIKSKMDLVDTLNTKINNMSSVNTWVPHLYDYNTKLRELSNGTGKYVKIGGVFICVFYGANYDFSGINTMMQIRNIPCDLVLGGSLYIDRLEGSGGTTTMQAADTRVYFRPNITSARISQPSNPGYTSCFFVGL